MAPGPWEKSAHGAPRTKIRIGSDHVGEQKGDSQHERGTLVETVVFRVKPSRGEQLKSQSTQAQNTRTGEAGRR